MGRLMPSHMGTPNGAPPLELLLPLIEKTATHWLWDGDFNEAEAMRFATFLWAAPGEVSVRYVVARVLWSITNNDTLAHRRLRNTCGLTTCVNPAHFERVLLKGEERLDLVTLPPGFKFGDGTTARLVRIAGSDHVHILRDDTYYTTCYKAARGAVSTPPGVVITCAKCVAEWRDFGRPLLRIS